MCEEGLIGPEEEPSAEELWWYDRNRKDKQVSNHEWENPHDPEAKITKMKDGRTHLACKAGHVVDLKTEAILAAEIYGADEADTATLAPSLERHKRTWRPPKVEVALTRWLRRKGIMPPRRLSLARNWSWWA
jgi:transposase